MLRVTAAGPLEDADAAIRRRDYPTAVRLVRPLAEQAIQLRDGIKCRLVAFHCRKSFAACCLPRHSGFLSFVFWPVGNDRTDELVQKVYRVAHGL